MSIKEVKMAKVRDSSGSNICKPSVLPVESDFFDGSHAGDAARIWLHANPSLNHPAGWEPPTT
jgi:hypothetical protein